MEIYTKANEKMADEITQVMTACFGDPIWVLKFFFRERFDMNNCYVCTIDGKIVSVLHVIKSKLKIGREILNGIYIYGACTLREYRNFGYMTNLLKYVHEVYSKSGYECSFLVPGKPQLVNFYEKNGYKNFFKVKRVELTKDELLELCKDDRNGEKEVLKDSLDFDEMVSLRQEIYQSHSYVIYSREDIEFAGKLYELFSSGSTVSTDSGYALCGFSSSGTVKVRDFTCRPSCEVELLKKIYERFPSQQKYIIETSTTNEFFEERGESVDYGMILPFSDLSRGLIESESFFSGGKNEPYLGISLE